MTFFYFRLRRLSLRVQILIRVPNRQALHRVPNRQVLTLTALKKIAQEKGGADAQRHVWFRSMSHPSRRMSRRARPNSQLL